MAGALPGLRLTSLFNWKRAREPWPGERSCWRSSTAARPGAVDVSLLVRGTASSVLGSKRREWLPGVGLESGSAVEANACCEPEPARALDRLGEVALSSSDAVSRCDGPSWGPPSAGHGSGPAARFRGPKGASDVS